MARSKVSRRDFIRFAGVASGAALLGACAPQVVRETQIVQQTQIVNQTQVVEEVQTQIVERVITPTPEPAIVTPQGKELPPDAAPLDQQVWRGAPGADPTFLDGSRDIYRAGGVNMITEPLLRNNENIELVPALADSWKVSEDGKGWEFVLRQGAVWSDDTPITPEDIIYTYEHAGDPKLGNQWISFLFTIKGLQDYALGTGPASAIGVTKIDDRTVRYDGQLGFVPYLPQLLAYQAAVYCPKHVVEKDPEHWADTAEGAISSGPYLCTTWDKGVKLEYSINPKYNGPHKPGIQVFTSQIAPSATAASNFNSWLNQEFEMIENLGPAELAALRADPKLNALIHFFPNFQSTYLQIDTLHPPLDNKDFRSALAKAIDRNTLAQQVWGGTQVSGHEMLPPGFPGYTDENKAAQEYNLEGAMADLAASGIDPASVTIKMYSRDVNDDRWLQFVQQQWQTNLGVASEIIQNLATWPQDRVEHKMQLNIGTYEYDFVDPSNMLTSLFHSIPAPEGKTEPWGSVRHNWKSDEYDALVDSADGETDVAARIKMYQDAQKILIDDVGVIFLAHNVIFQVWWPWITGFHPDKFGNVVFRWLDIARYQGYITKNQEELKAQFR